MVIHVPVGNFQFAISLNLSGLFACNCLMTYRGAFIGQKVVI